MYNLFYEFGVHHIPISCTKEDFFKVIDDLSTEFEIFKTQDGSILNYCIVDYYGEKRIIGFYFDV